MTILVDHQIASRVKKSPTLATNVTGDNYLSAESQIQAASLDLTIGDIYIPGTKDSSPGGSKSPLHEFSLNQGRTAVIRTKESLSMGTDLAGIAFPPSSVSLKGLLMTNPGHIDPGYNGTLHLTVINMSNDPFSLRRGDRIMRVLFIELAQKPCADYSVRAGTNLRKSPITSGLLRRLSVDFVNVDGRAKQIADATVSRAQLWAALVSIPIPVVVAVLTIFGSYWEMHNGDTQNLKERVAVIEIKLGGQALDDRVRKLEDAVAKLTALERKK